MIETHTSYPKWNTLRSTAWIKTELEKLFPQNNAQVATGVTKRGEKLFNFLLVSQINKGTILQELKIKYASPLIITIGDTEVDFPMHRLAHKSYHVGRKSEWEKLSLPHCTLVLSDEGEDCQHVEGTLKALKSIAQFL